MAFLLLWFPLAVDVKEATPAIQQLTAKLFCPNTAFSEVLHRLKNNRNVQETMLKASVIYSDFALLEMSMITAGRAAILHRRLCVPGRFCVYQVSRWKAGAQIA